MNVRFKPMTKKITLIIKKVHLVGILSLVNKKPINKRIDTVLFLFYKYMEFSVRSDVVEC